MKLVWCFVFVVTVVYATTEPFEPQYQVVSTVNFEKVHDILIYEGSYPLTFDVIIPIMSKCPDGDEKNCGFSSFILALHGEQHKEEYNEYDREKRQAVALTWICGYLSRPLIHKFLPGICGDDEDEERMKQLQTNFKELIHTVTDFNRGMTDHMLEVERELQTTKESIVFYSKAINDLRNRLRDHVVSTRLLIGFETCKSKFIPSTVLPAADFRQALRRLNSSLERNGHTVAVGRDNIDILYKLPISDCQIAEEHKLKIIVNIPVIKTGTKYQLFQVNHQKFAFYGQVCEAEPAETAFIAHEKASNKVVLISQHLKMHCSPYEHKLCLVPPYTQDSPESLHCVGGILRNQSFEELRRVCGFKCSSDNGLSISQISEKEIYVTNAKEILYMCEDFNRTIKSPEVGSVYLKLTCKCELIVDGTVMPHRFPCDNDDQFHTSTTVHVPELWVHEDHEVKIGQKFPNGTFIDTKWHTKVPTFNFTATGEENYGHFHIHYAVTAIIVLAVVWFCLPNWLKNLLTIVCRRNERENFVVVSKPE